ncbi:hypothetical protein ACH4A8_30860 [Streptomyces vietnamensis]|uniref:hypothetical protein n=1 Tax=Streptomyces vietnamensis TaxID=362257 RepID=UPI0037B96018
MTEQSPKEPKETVNQTNTGPGTFVNGNIFGNILNIFATSHRRRPSPPAPDDRALIEGDDYEDVGFRLLFSACLVAGFAVETRARVFAYPPAAMARLLATACSVTASMAAFVAMFFGWSTFGAVIQERAHIARGSAAVNAARARAAVQGSA